MQNGKTIFGIYEIRSDTLTVVVGLPGQPARPLSLDEPRGAVERRVGQRHQGDDGVVVFDDWPKPT